LLVSKLALAQPPHVTTPATDPPFSIAVEKDDATVSCPDLKWFQARIAAHAGQAGHAGKYRITLGKRANAWRASIAREQPNSGAPAPERVLSDRSPTCQPLAEAAALTVAILANDNAPRPESETTTEPVAEERRAIDVTPSAPVSAPPSRTKVWVGAGGGAAMAFISPLAPELGFGITLDSLDFSTGLRVMLTTQQKFALDPGHVVVQAWLATAFSCLRFARGHLGAALCGTFDGGMLRASADGFDNGKPSSRGYEALGLELHPSWNVSESYRILAVFGAMLPFRRESFSVVGRGMAYVPPPLNWRILLFSEIGAF
jgi:hypothetical protein